MARRALGPGETGATTFHGKHPETGRWTKESKLKEEGLRPKLWRASVRYHDPDRRAVREITAQGSTKGKAQAALDDAVSAAKDGAGLHRGAGAMTVGTALRGRLRELEEGQHDYSHGTIEEYASLMRKHMLCDESIIRDVPLRDLTPLQILEDMNRISNLGAGSRLRHYRANLNVVLDKAVMAKAIESNPLLLVGKTPKPRRKQAKVYGNGSARRKNRALSAEEIERLEKQLEKEPEHVADLIRVMLSMGLRISEAVSLRRQDIDLEEGTLSVAGKLVRIRGGGQVWEPFLKNDLSRRTLPMREKAEEAVLRRMAQPNKGWVGKYLFATPRGGVPDVDNYGTLLRNIFDRAGLADVTSHTLRRTVERDLEQAGIPWSEREVWMGHTERVARMHYSDHSTVSSSVADQLDQKAE